jgi:membrane protease subunit (stomatin/prohibitin family)
MVFNFLSGQFIDVIEWTDDTRDTMVYRFERQGHEIKYGAKLTVREGQTAVFIHEGQLADIFTPGLYMLETNNMPILTTLQHWDHGFKSPFKSEIYFVNTNRFTDLKWGTKNPIMLRDPGIRADAHPGLRYLHREGRRCRPLHDRDRGHGRGVHHRRDHLPDPQHHRAAVQPDVAGSGIPVLDMAANTGEFGKLVASRISETIGQYGLTLPELYIENISLPPAVEEALDKRTSMGVVGDLNKYTQYSAAEAMQAAASGSGDGGTMGAGLGAGLGMAMGNMMMGAGGPLGRCPRTGRRPRCRAAPAAGRACLAHRRERRDEGSLLQGRHGPDGHRGQPDPRNLRLDRRSGRLDEGRGRAELAQLFTVLPPPPPPPAG